MVELNGGRVLEEVSPPQVRLVCGFGVARVEELVRRWCEATTHERELVVEQTCVKTCDEGTCMNALGHRILDVNIVKAYQKEQ